MGTRSLTFVYNEHGRILVNMYGQYDGYPSHHGRLLAEFLLSIEAVTNGIQSGETRRTANGMGCLAAQMIVSFKQDVGQYYIYPADSGDVGQDYEYHVYLNRVRVIDYNGCEVFDGSWKKFMEFCNCHQ